MMPTSLFPVEAVLTVPGPRLELVDGAGSWIFRLPQELRGLNRTMWAHWRTAQRVRQDWELELRCSIATFASLRLADAHVDHVAAAAFRRLVLDTPHRERRRVRVVRFVPNARNFLRDDENLSACTKHLIDAMTRVRLIVDDSRTWIYRAAPAQHVSPDGKFWTVIQLDRPDVRSAWRV